MKLALVSSDMDLRRSIQEILSPYSSIQLFHPSEVPQTQDAFDICMWDFEPGAPLPSIGDPSEARRHLFLVKRKDLAAFRGAVTTPGVGILLKPVAGPILAAFVEHAASNRARAELRPGDRDQILQSLIQANLKLQELDQDRANFLARAVHDFRAPLTALSGYCGLLLGGQLGPLETEQRDVLVRMEQSAKRLSRMASAMFQFSAGRMVNCEPHWQPGELRQSVEQALHEISPLTDEKGIEILFDWVAPADTMYFDGSQLEQVLVNLLENACKFVPKFGVVEIKGYPYIWERRAEGGAHGRPEDHAGAMERVKAFRVDIRDSGPSIPARYLDKIFEEYTTYAGGRDRSGGGLGLAICRSIIGHHHGRIWAENSSQGTVFSFLLPIGSEGKAVPIDDSADAASGAIAMEAQTL